MLDYNKLNKYIKKTKSIIYMLMTATTILFMLFLYCIWNKYLHGYINYINFIAMLSIHILVIYKLYLNLQNCNRLKNAVEKYKKTGIGKPDKDMILITILFSLYGNDDLVMKK